MNHILQQVKSISVEDFKTAVNKLFRQTTMLEKLKSEVHAVTR